MRAQSFFPASRFPDTIFFRSASFGTNPHLTEFADHKPEAGWHQSYFEYMTASEKWEQRCRI
jgi:hypothetical protein